MKYVILVLSMVCLFVTGILGVGLYKTGDGSPAAMIFIVLCVGVTFMGFCTFALLVGLESVEDAVRGEASSPGFFLPKGQHNSYGRKVQ